MPHAASAGNEERAGDAREPWVRLAPWVLAAVFVALLLPKIGAGTLWQNDELLTANRAREMLVRRDPWAVTLNFQPDFKKPPLQYWVTAALLAGLPGWREGAVRLPALLFGAGCLVAVAWVARGSFTWCREEDAAFLGLAAAGALVGCGFFIHLSRVGLLDCGAAFFLLGALGGCARAERDGRWWWFVALMVVLGAWQKAPYAFGAWAAVLAARTVRDPAGTWRRDRHLPAALLVAVLAAMAWPAWQWARFGTEALGNSWGRQLATLARAHDPGDRGFQPWRYWFWLARDWAAVGALAPLAVGATLWRGRRTGGAGFELALVCAVYALTLALVPFRAERYLACVAPLLALVTVREIWERLPGAGCGRTLGLALALGTALPVAAFHYVKPAPARPELKAAARALGDGARAADRAEIFVNTQLVPGFNNEGFLLFYADLPRPARVLRRKRLGVLLRTTRAPAGRIGVGRADGGEGGPVETVSTHGEWRIWRQVPAASPALAGQG